MITHICGIEHTNDQFIIAFTHHGVSNLNAECRIASCVLAHFCSIYPYFGTPINGTEIEHHPLFLVPLFRYLEDGAIPQSMVLIE